MGGYTIDAVFITITTCDSDHGLSLTHVSYPCLKRMTVLDSLDSKYYCEFFANYWNSIIQHPPPNSGQ